MKRHHDQDSIWKTAYGRQHLMGAFHTVSKDKSMVIVARSMAEGRHCAGAGAEILSAAWRQREGGRLDLVWAFETSNPPFRDTPPATRPYLLALPKQLFLLNCSHICRPLSFKLPQAQIFVGC